jgi:hypothetical protein
MGTGRRRNLKTQRARRAAAEVAEESLSPQRTQRKAAKGAKKSGNSEEGVSSKDSLGKILWE